MTGVCADPLLHLQHRPSILDFAHEDFEVCECDGGHPATKALVAA